MSGLRVGLIAPPWVPVPPVVYGGTELVIDLLARGLAAAGCDVVLFATGDSTCPVPLRWRYQDSLGTVVAPAGERAHVEQAYRELAEVDILHDHTEAGPARSDLHPAGTPIVTTVHGELTPHRRELYSSAASSGVAVVAISDAQRRAAPDVPVTTVIHHGIDVASIPMGRGDGGYLLFLGRMHPDKGAHRAIEIARAAGKRLVLAAKMWQPEEIRYFTEQVEPHLGDDAVFLGEVGGHRKLELLGGAEALVNPIRWNEPFGLVMIEAMACGTPVLSFAEGAAPEIIDDGRTGFLCADEADMVKSISTITSIDRAACRAHVERRFSSSRMVADHLALYDHLLPDRSVVHLGEHRATDTGDGAPACTQASA